MLDTGHYIDASAREKLIEHLLIGELQKHLWKSGIRDCEVLHAEVDSAGYDIVLEACGTMRHVQLKASYLEAKTARVPINTRLAAKTSGCVIWIWFDPDTLELGPFLWFGGEPGQALPDLGDKIALHKRRNKEGNRPERPRIREVNKGRFAKLESVEALAEALFGEECINR